jgi:hypothetical protein
MKLENQVCSSELSQILEKLGVKQKSLFYWVYEHFEKEKWELVFADDFVSINPFVSAFTVAELGEMLPQYIYKNEDGYFLEMYKHREEGFQIRYKTSESIFENKDCVIACTCEVNEADARAKMLCFLLENNLMEIEK